MKYRNATMGDADFLFKLKNDPVMRKFAVVTHGKIKLKDHLKWLNEHVNEMYIALDKKERIGMFRISKDKELSLNIAPQYRGKGYGTKVLKLCPKGLWAKIVNGNVPSMRLFLNSGFKITDYQSNYYVLKN